MKEETIDFIVSNNLETNLTELDRALKCLNKFKYVGAILDDIRGYKILKFIRYVTEMKKFQYEIDLDSLFEPSNAYGLFYNILDHLYSIVDDLDFENCSRNFNLKIEAEYLVYNSDHEHLFIKWGKSLDWQCYGGKLFGQCDSNLKKCTKDDTIYKCTICHVYNLCQSCFDSPRAETTFNEQRVFILDDILAILSNLIPFATKLKYFLLEKSKLKTLLDLIDHRTFVKNAYFYNHEILKSFLSIINCLSKYSHGNKSDWKELNAIGALLNILTISSKFGQSIYSSIANIIDDVQIEELTGLVQTMIEIDVKQVHKFASHFKKDKLIRTKQQFRDQNNKIFLYEVMVILTKLGQVSLTDCLHNIKRLALNPKSRFEIYNKNSLRKSLKIIIKHGNDIEKQFSINLIAQLAFDPRVLDQIIGDLKLISAIKKLSKDDSIQLKKLKIVCKQLLWLIEEAGQDQGEQCADHINEHIMISYHWFDKDICFRIKNELEKDNYKVWIDLNEINGSSLDSMAKAAERSKCVLMCFTEKYRQSLNCQAEAQYTLKLKKKIIPCIMQKGYHNIRGWLGTIIDQNDYIVFSIQDFNDCLFQLKTKLANSIDIHLALPQSIDSKNMKSNSLKDNQINDWKEQDVQLWFKETNLIQSFIFKALFPCNGKLLIQLRQMQMYAPEFFFKSISPKTLNINDLKTIALFSMQLSELFNDNQT